MCVVGGVGGGPTQNNVQMVGGGGVEGGGGEGNTKQCANLVTFCHSLGQELWWY